MRQTTANILLALITPTLIGLAACGGYDDMTTADPTAGVVPENLVTPIPAANSVRRTPAEWEPQSGVWLQWPQSWEGAQVERSFVEIVTVIAEYENVHLLATDAATQRSGEQALSGANASRITWHQIANDSSWMRDNGPRYVEVDGQLTAQNWEFDAWGGGFGDDVPYAADNAVPGPVAAFLNLPIEQVHIVHERGDLEVNGTDTALVSWSVLSQRNPAMDRATITAGIQEALGVTSVIYTEGFHPLDGTRGHVDGMARFISEDTIVVGDDGGQLMNDVAAQIAAQRPDLTIERMTVSPDAPTLNWLIGDGFVLTGTSGDAATDTEARQQLQRYFPGRDIRFVNIDALWANGGGVHCVTNDVPEL